MHALLEETLRMATPAPGTFPRIAQQDHYLGDIQVKKGTFIFPLFTPSMFSEELYKDPFVFRPERWIKGSEFYERPSDPFAFTPFSAGPRNCIGQHMSLMEGKLILCHFLKKFDFRLIEGYKLEMVTRFMAEPKDPLKFILSKKI
jgi:cytochrome P450